MLKATLMVICLINLASGGVVKRETNATWTNIDKDTGAYCDLSAKESKLSCNGQMIVCDATFNFNGQDSVKEFGIGVPAKDAKKETNIHPLISNNLFGTNTISVSGKPDILSIHHSASNQVYGITVTDEKCFARVQNFFKNVALLQTLILGIKSESNVIGSVKLV